MRDAVVGMLAVIVTVIVAVVVAVSVAMSLSVAMTLPVINLVWHEVEDEEHAVGGQTRGETGGSELGVVKVVEAQAYAGEVEVLEGGRGEEALFFLFGDEISLVSLSQVGVESLRGDC